MNDILKAIDSVGLFGKVLWAFLAAGITWLFVRKKQDAETSKTKADANKTQLETIIATQRYNKEAYKELLIEVDLLREENKKLRDLNENHARKINELTRKINALDTFKSIYKK